MTDRHTDRQADTRPLRISVKTTEPIFKQSELHVDL